MRGTPKGNRSGRAGGFTLIEVLLASSILAFGLAVLLTGASKCLGTMRMAKNFQKAQTVLGLGELEHPLAATNDVKLLEVSPKEYDGFFFSREVEDDDDEDGLFVVRTKVTWSEARREAAEEVVQYVLQRDD